MAFTATTTAWGAGDPLDVTLERIDANCPDATTVELSIGARPHPHGPDLLASWADRFTFIAHHTAPIGAGRSIRPSLETSPHASAASLRRVGITRYSGHPPPIKHADHDQFDRWAFDWWQALASCGISWSIETMYVPQTSSDIASAGGHHLSTPAEAWAFVERATAAGWADPLLIDVSHLNIGLHAGIWTETDILELVATAPASELHVSTNDGRRDLHSPIGPGDRIWSWVEPHLGRFTWVVDEGRRSGPQESS